MNEVDNYPDDEIPTAPGNPKVDVDLMDLLKLYACFSLVEKRRFGRMSHNWYRSSTDQQVLLEETAREFAEHQ